MKSETMLPLGKVDPGLREPDPPLDEGLVLPRDRRRRQRRGDDQGGARRRRHHRTT